MRFLVFLIGIFLFAKAAFCASDAANPQQLVWGFEGVIGTFDRSSAQRGYQVYKEVCASCHSLRLLSYRNLEEIGFSEEEVKAIAASVEVVDGPDSLGDMFTRPGRPSDRFVAPFDNEQAARAANNGAYPPDLSLITKARPNGANYIYSLLTGYAEPPTDFKLGEAMYYNKYFPGQQIAMPPPLSEGLIDYQDGTPSTIHQQAVDVVNFLTWAAEPEMEKRKRMGIKVILYLIIFTVFFYLAKKRIWADVVKKKD